MALPRVRQHVNPLSDRYQIPTPPPQWDEVYANPQQPFLLDIGSAKGIFLLGIAQQQPERNFLGLEIRAPLVKDALNKQQQLGLTNLHFMFCNVTPSLDVLLASLPGVLDQVTIQFPDPWFKKRHQKRRVVQPELVQAIATHLVPGGFVFLQSDIESVALSMCNCFSAHPAFTLLEAVDNPFPASTEREMMTLERSGAIYRFQLARR